MDPVPTQYIDRDGAALAYQVIGGTVRSMSCTPSKSSSTWICDGTIRTFITTTNVVPPFRGSPSSSGASGLTFASRGEHELKGIPGSWELFAVTHAGDQSESVPHEASMETAMDKLALQTARRAPRLARAGVRLGNAIERRRART